MNLDATDAPNASGRESRVAVAGDWHGSAPWVGRAIPAVARAGRQIRTILHVGDFGLEHTARGRNYLDGVDYWCKQGGIARVLVTPGNHEDWEWLEADFSAMPGEPVPVSRCVAVLPRGFRFTIGGSTFLSFGGAASIDFEYRVEGRDWFPSELPSVSDVTYASGPGTADVMLAHETVNGGTTATEHAIATNRGQWSATALHYSALSRSRVTEVWNAVKPSLLLHGHMHVADDIVRPDGRRVISLGRDGQNRNIGLLDTQSLAWEWLDDLQGIPTPRRTLDVEHHYLQRPD